MWPTTWSIWSVQRWNSHFALFPRSCLIFQVPQSHMVGQTAGLPAEGRTMNWDLSNDWQPRASCCSTARLPQAGQLWLQLRHLNGTFKTPVKRDGYFLYVPWQHFFSTFFYLHFFNFVLQLKCLFAVKNRMHRKYVQTEFYSDSSYKFSWRCVKSCTIVGSVLWTNEIWNI